MHLLRRKTALSMVASLVTLGSRTGLLPSRESLRQHPRPVARGLALSRYLVCQRDLCSDPKTPYLEVRRVQPPTWQPEHSCWTVGEKSGPVRTRTGRHEHADGGERWCCHVITPTRRGETLRLCVPRAHVGVASKPDSGWPPWLTCGLWVWSRGA